MKLKKVLAICLSAAMAFSIVGCAGAAPAAPAADAAPAAEEAASAEEPASMGGSVEGELNVTIWDENQRAGLQEIVDDWSAISGVKATIQVVNWDNY